MPEPNEEESNNLPSGMLTLFLAGKIKNKTTSQDEVGYFLDIFNKLFNSRDIIVSLLNIQQGLSKELLNSWDETKKEEIAYELDNFYLRVYMFHQRMIQLINSVYLNLSPSNTSISNEIKSNKKTKKAAVLLDNFEQRNSEALKTRRLLTHQSFEHYPSLPMPSLFNKNELIRKEREKEIYEEISKNKIKETNGVLKECVKFFDETCNVILVDVCNSFGKISRIF